MVVHGIPTVIPFDLAVVSDPAFAPAEGPFSVHTRWIETEFVNDLPAWTPDGAAPEAEEAGERRTVVVEVGGKRLEVALPASLGFSGAASSAGAKPAKSKKRSRSGGATAAAGVSRSCSPPGSARAPAPPPRPSPRAGPAARRPVRRPAATA
jgi:acetyl-CoA/propionyl-CoA carboxylase biotin carboxyl carrier protein